MCEKALPLEIPMKLLLTLATSFALVSLVHPQEDYHHPDKDQAIRAVEQHLSARFVKEGMSSDGRSVRWEFLFSPYHGIPVVIDLIAFPTVEQMEAASVAAFTEAQTVYLWLNDTQHSGVPKVPKAVSGAKSPITSKDVDDFLAKRKKEQEINAQKP
jgi:hypothetical protein